MSSFQRPVSGVLGVGAVGTAASAATGSKTWLIVSGGLTATAGCIALVMSLIARHHSR